MLRRRGQFGLDDEMTLCHRRLHVQYREHFMGAPIRAMVNVQVDAGRRTGA